MKTYPVNWEPIYLETEQTEDKIKASYAQKFNLYGLTKEKFLELAKKQEYLCAVCNASSKDAPHRLCVDHNYTTNEIRGLLCSSCNFALGVMADDVKALQRAVDYLGSSGTGVFVKDTFG